MQAEEYLKGVYLLKLRIALKKREQQTVRDRASSATSTLSAVRSSGTNNHSKVETVITAIDLDKQIQKSIDKLNLKEYTINEILSNIDDNLLETLLEMRYLHNASWKHIGQELGYGSSYVYYTLHPKALKEFQKYML